MAPSSSRHVTNEALALRSSVSLPKVDNRLEDPIVGLAYLYITAATLPANRAQVVCRILAGASEAFLGSKLYDPSLILEKVARHTGRSIKEVFTDFFVAQNINDPSRTGIWQTLLATLRKEPLDIFWQVCGRSLLHLDIRGDSKSGGALGFASHIEAARRQAKNFFDAATELFGEDGLTSTPALVFVEEWHETIGEVGRRVFEYELLKSPLAEISQRISILRGALESAAAQALAMTTLVSGDSNSTFPRWALLKESQLQSPLDKISKTYARFIESAPTIVSLEEALSLRRAIGWCESCSESAFPEPALKDFAAVISLFRTAPFSVWHEYGRLVGEDNPDENAIVRKACELNTEFIDHLILKEKFDFTKKADIVERKQFLAAVVCAIYALGIGHLRELFDAAKTEKTVSPHTVQFVRSVFLFSSLDNVSSFQKILQGKYIEPSSVIDRERALAEGSIKTEEIKGNFSRLMRTARNYQLICEGYYGTGLIDNFTPSVLVIMRWCEALKVSVNQRDLQTAKSLVQEQLEFANNYSREERSFLDSEQAFLTKFLETVWKKEGIPLCINLKSMLRTWEEQDETLFSNDQDTLRELLEELVTVRKCLRLSSWQEITDSANARQNVVIMYNHLAELIISRPSLIQNLLDSLVEDIKNGVEFASSLGDLESVKRDLKLWDVLTRSVRSKAVQQHEEIVALLDAHEARNTGQVSSRREAVGWKNSARDIKEILSKIPNPEIRAELEGLFDSKEGYTALETNQLSLNSLERPNRPPSALAIPSFFALEDLKKVRDRSNSSPPSASVNVNVDQPSPNHIVAFAKALRQALTEDAALRDAVTNFTGTPESCSIFVTSKKWFDLLKLTVEQNVLIVRVPADYESLQSGGKLGFGKKLISDLRQGKLGVFPSTARTDSIQTSKISRRMSAEEYIGGTLLSLKSALGLWIPKTQTLKFPLELARCLGFLHAQEIIPRLVLESLLIAIQAGSFQLTRSSRPSPGFSAFAATLGVKNSDTRTALLIAKLNVALGSPTDVVKIMLSCRELCRKGFQADYIRLVLSELGERICLADQKIRTRSLPESLGDFTRISEIFVTLEGLRILEPSAKTDKDVADFVDTYAGPYFFNAAVDVERKISVFSRAKESASALRSLKSFRSSLLRLVSVTTPSPDYLCSGFAYNHPSEELKISYEKLIERIEFFSRRLELIESARCTIIVKTSEEDGSLTSLITSISLVQKIFAANESGPQRDSAVRFLCQEALAGSSSKDPNVATVMTRVGQAAAASENLYGDLMLLAANPYVRSDEERNSLNDIVRKISKAVLSVVDDLVQDDLGPEAFAGVENSLQLVSSLEPVMTSPLFWDAKSVALHQNQLSDIQLRGEFIKLERAQRCNDFSQMFLILHQLENRLSTSTTQLFRSKKNPNTLFDQATTVALMLCLGRDLNELDQRIQAKSNFKALDLCRTLSEKIAVIPSVRCAKSAQKQVTQRFKEVSQAIHTEAWGAVLQLKVDGTFEAQRDALSLYEKKLEDCRVSGIPVPAGEFAKEAELLAQTIDKEWDNEISALQKLREFDAAYFYAAKVGGFAAKLDPKSTVAKFLNQRVADRLTAMTERLLKIAADDAENDSPTNARSSLKAYQRAATSLFLKVDSSAVNSAVADIVEKIILRFIEELNGAQKLGVDDQILSRFKNLIIALDGTEKEVILLTEHAKRFEGAVGQVANPISESLALSIWKTLKEHSSKHFGLEYDRACSDLAQKVTSHLEQSWQEVVESRNPERIWEFSAEPQKIIELAERMKDEHRLFAVNVVHRANEKMTQSTRFLQQYLLKATVPHEISQDEQFQENWIQGSTQITLYAVTLLNTLKDWEEINRTFALRTPLVTRDSENLIAKIVEQITSGSFLVSTLQFINVVAYDTAPWCFQKMRPDAQVKAEQKIVEFWPWLSERLHIFSPYLQLTLDSEMSRSNEPWRDLTNSVGQLIDVFKAALSLGIPVAEDPMHFILYKFCPGAYAEE